MVEKKSERNVHIVHPTELMIWLEMDWKKSGLKQSAYCQSIGIVDMEAFGWQTLSKVIGGRVRNVPPMLLEVLSKNKGFTRDQLVKMHEEKIPSPEESDPGEEAISNDLFTRQLAELADKVRELEADASLYRWLRLNRKDRNLQRLLSHFHRLEPELKALGLLKEE